MGIILIDSAIRTQPTSTLPTRVNTSYPQYKSGFQDQLNEAIKASDGKSTLKARTDTEHRQYQLNDSMNQLVNSGTKQTAMNMGNNRLSSGMINQYLAQERKDEKSGKGRAISDV